MTNQTIADFRNARASYDRGVAAQYTPTMWCHVADHLLAVANRLVAMRTVMGHQLSQVARDRAIDAYRRGGYSAADAASFVAAST